LEGWSWEIGRHNTAVLVCFAEISPEKGTQINLPAMLFSFFKHSYVAWISAQKTSA
jgi:hypothetical protein